MGEAKEKRAPMKATTKLEKAGVGRQLAQSVMIRSAEA